MSEEARPADPARRALEQARLEAKRQGREVGSGTGRPTAPRRRLRKRGWTGPGQDPWDPQPLGELMSRVSNKRGWSAKVTDGRVMARWSSIVGEDIASKVTPVRIEDSVLEVSAESTAWATQVRLMSRSILQSIAKEIGPGHVKRIKVSGPAKPSWHKGPLHVKGRGPRDTYG